MHTTRYLLTRSNSGAEKILVLSECEPTEIPEANRNAINDQGNIPAVLGVQSLTLFNQENPAPSETPNVSSSSPHKFDLFEVPVDAMEEVKEKGAASKLSSVSSRSIKMETKTLEKKISAEMMRKRKEMELTQQQRELGIHAKCEAM